MLFAFGFVELKTIFQQELISWSTPVHVHDLSNLTYISTQRCLTNLQPDQIRYEDN